MASIREVMGIYGPGPAYFVQKLQNVDSTKKTSARPFFPCEQRWKNRRLEEQSMLPSPASYNMPPVQTNRRLSPFNLPRNISNEKLETSSYASKALATEVQSPKESQPSKSRNYQHIKFGTTAKLLPLAREKDLISYPGPGYYLGLETQHSKNVIFPKQKRSSLVPQLIPGPGDYNLPEMFPHRKDSSTRPRIKAKAVLSK